MDSSVFCQEHKDVDGCLVGGIVEPRWRKRNKIKEEKCVTGGEENMQEKKR